MSDLALVTVPGDLLAGFDLALSNGDLLLDDSLRTAVLVSLFSDRGSWWGDVLNPQAGDRIGSDLHLLAREKRQPEVLARTRETIRTALAWLLADGVANAVDVQAEFSEENTGRDRIGVVIAIDRPQGRELIRFADIWQATLDG